MRECSVLVTGKWIVSVILCKMVETKVCPFYLCFQMYKIHGFGMFWNIPDLDWFAQEIGSGFQINFPVLVILSEIIFL